MKTIKPEFLFNISGNVFPEPVKLFGRSINESAVSLLGESYSNIYEKIKVGDQRFLISMIRIEGPTSFINPNAAITFERIINGLHVKKRLLLAYFIELNQFVWNAVQIGFDIPLILDEKTQISIDLPEGSDNEYKITFYPATQPIPENESERDDLFSKCINSALLYDDVIYFQNIGDSPKKTSVYFGERGIEYEHTSPQIDVHNGHYPYLPEDKIYLRKSFCNSVNGTSDSGRIMIGKEGEGENVFLWPTSPLTRFCKHVDIVQVNDAEVNLLQKEKALTVTVPANSVYCLFLNKNRVPIFKDWMQAARFIYSSKSQALLLRDKLKEELHLVEEAIEKNDFDITE